MRRHSPRTKRRSGGKNAKSGLESGGAERLGEEVGLLFGRRAVSDEHVALIDSGDHEGGVDADMTKTAGDDAATDDQHDGPVVLVHRGGRKARDGEDDGNGGTEDDEVAGKPSESRELGLARRERRGGLPRRGGEEHGAHDLDEDAGARLGETRRAVVELVREVRVGEGTPRSRTACARRTGSRRGTGGTRRRRLPVAKGGRRPRRGRLGRECCRKMTWATRSGTGRARPRGRCHRMHAGGRCGGRRRSTAPSQSRRA
mmetsp:Transcript_25402/g.101223  ORF Transcript_25402/g.101223 Transcript_25402/m.101223 type:complete len:258 (+) Transcript_25402:172-945(+)